MIYLLLTLALSIVLPSILDSKKLHIFGGIFLPLLIITQISWFLYNGEHPQTNITYILPLSLTLTTISAYFICFICGLWAVASVYAVCYVEYNYGRQKLNTFMIFYNLAVVSSIFIALSANLITTFIFYEILTISTLPLVGFGGKPETRTAITKYTFILSFTAIAFFLPAVFLFQNIIGTTEFMPNGLVSQMFMQTSHEQTLYDVLYTPPAGLMLLILVMLIFGVAKSAIFPFNGWLPSAMCAPAPVSALLHAVAVVKSGAFVVYKIIYELYGIEYFSYLKQLYQPFFTMVLAFVVFGIFVASIRAMRATDLKKILAFSTISNMSYIFLLFFIGSENAMTAGFWHILVHGITKITLFFIAGVLYSIYHTNNYQKMTGIFHGQKLLAFSMLMSSLALMGMPLTSGFLSKHFTIDTLIGAGEILALCGIVFSTLATTYYLGKPLIYMNIPVRKVIISKQVQSIIHYIIFPLAFLNFCGFFAYFITTIA